MSAVASRELRNQTRALLDRVAAGETITITIDGRPVAVLERVRHRPRWMARSAFAQLLTANQADPGLSADLIAMSDETTDDLPM